MGNALITYWNSVSSSISNITTATWSGISYPFTWPSASASGSYHMLLWNTECRFCDLIQPTGTWVGRFLNYRKKREDPSTRFRQSIIQSLRFPSYPEKVQTRVGRGEEQVQEKVKIPEQKSGRILWSKLGF
ncbi:uncharacterized protein LOC111696646 isoform X1 [Eurytemora carolleeae]|uniref:uncharacterized protein LOC111696646 isoform X1 n=1 Tax=Eurytemora carolleeae TaxID=1294199 RepID=UPI000C756AAE|nr:uncharacterized protein LOC111696646 isoform X1 [Eurytemora carolleeae]|eukprot:XP_023322088.1 uncharacterized protein LOC111696646 isoform X1 [Eurytemora affinis]